MWHKPSHSDSVQRRSAEQAKGAISKRARKLVEQGPLTDRTITEIRLLSEIARANHSHVSLQDITALTSTELDETQVRTALETTPRFRTSFELKQDLVVDRTEDISEKSLLSGLRERKSRAKQFIQSARSFQRLCHTRETTVLAVSGSTSYYSTMPGDDLDFFTITKQDTLWILLFKSLILARTYRLLHPAFPRICFSYAIDDKYARNAFATDDLLFARDALNAVVLHGQNFYETLLKQNPWMANYFPQLYRLKTNQPREKALESSSKKAQFSRFLNLFLYLTLGPYLQVKSALLNRSLQQKRMTRSLFTIRSGPDHFVLESIRYKRLRQMYDQLGETIRATPSTADTRK